MQWHQFLRHSELQISELLHSVGPSDPEFIAKLHATASSSFVDCFPAGQGTHQLPHWTHNRSIILDKWQHRACCQRLQIVTLRNVLHAWFHTTRFQV